LRPDEDRGLHELELEGKDEFRGAEERVVGCKAAKAGNSSGYSTFARLLKFQTERDNFLRQNPLLWVGHDWDLPGFCG
jgi:hypothetical protein